MKELIRRPYIPVYVEPQATRDAFQNTLLPNWYWEASKLNSFTYRFNYKVTSIFRDIQHEQLLWLSKFLYRDLDITKPDHAKVIRPELAIARKQTRFSPSIDVLYDDVYRYGSPIPDLGQREEAILLSLLDNLGALEHITDEDINTSLAADIPIRKILSSLLPGEAMLSGRLLSPTTYGRMVSFGDIPESPLGINDNNSVLNGNTSADGLYVILPSLTVESSIVFSPAGAENDIALTSFIDVIGRFSTVGSYNAIWDVDQDGYISPEDISYLEQLIGLKMSDFSEREWNEKYIRFDTNKDGTISYADVRYGITLLGAVATSCMIVRNPYGLPVNVTYRYHQTPYMTYYSEYGSTSGGTFGAPDLLLGTGVDDRIKDGAVFSSTDVTLGINIDNNEIWVGRRTELGWTLSRIARPEPDRMLVRGITEIDNVAFILVVSETGSALPDGPYEGYSAGLVRVDLLREALEITEDLIPIQGIEFDTNELATGVVTTNRKDRFRILTDAPRIITVQLGRNSIVHRDQDVLVSQDNTFPEVRRQRVYNDVDNMAFNFGVYRYLGETTEELYLRIKESLADPAGNDLQGFYKGIGRTLGLPIPILAGPKKIVLSNAPVPDSMTIELEDVFGERMTLGTPTVKVVSESFKVYLDGLVSSQVIDTDAYTVYTFPEGSVLIGNLLILSLTTLRTILVGLIKKYPYSITYTFRNSERFMQFANRKVRVRYEAFDADNVKHSDIVETFNIDIPCLDQLEAYISTKNSPEAILPLHPASELAKYLPSIYALLEPDIEFYIGKSRLDEILADLVLNDKSKWKTTDVDLSIFGEAYRSDYIVRKTLYNQNQFDEQLIEVEL